MATISSGLPFEMSDRLKRSGSTSVGIPIKKTSQLPVIKEAKPLIPLGYLGEQLSLKTDPISFTT